MSLSAEMPTAPGLLKMESRGARLIVAAAIAALVASVFADRRGVDSVLLLALSVALVSLAMMVMVVAWSDPIPLWAALLVVALVVVACALTCVGVRHAPVNAGQTNAMGASIAVLAFLCVRGRIAVVWMTFGVTVAIFGMWGAATGQGVLGGVLYVAPNVAVLGMATLFAAIMRPAAADIGRLRALAVAEAAEIAATVARREVRRAQQETLRTLARPTMEAVVSNATFSDAEAEATRLLARRVRDSVRAPSLNVPVVVAAVAAARARGVEVVLFDDGGLDGMPTELRDAFCTFVADWLDRAAEGKATVRIAPPGRPLIGSIVGKTAVGPSRSHMDTAGQVHMS